MTNLPGGSSNSMARAPLLKSTSKSALSVAAARRRYSASSDWSARFLNSCSSMRDPNLDSNRNVPAAHPAQYFYIATNKLATLGQVAASATLGKLLMMESACLRHTEIPHTSALFSDFQYHFGRVARFYAHNPHDGRSYAAAAQQLSYPDDRRAALVTALRASNSETASLDLLARPGTVAVVTGQQVGLFSGPAYTIYKALTAVRLAERLTEQGIPAVPMFWLATEDHDVAEVNHTFVFGPDHRPIQLVVDADGAPERSVGAIS